MNAPTPIVRLKALGRAGLAGPAAATVALCFLEGGYFPGVTAIAAVAAVVAVVLRLTLASRPWEGWSVGLSVATGALVLFVVWILVSAQWSDAPGRALLEFDRALLYLAVLVLLGLFAARADDLGVLLRWTAGAIFIVCAVALYARLVPESISTSRAATNERLAFPLTYWNTMGALAAVGLVLSLYVASSVRQPAIARVLASASFPVVAVTLYFTFSRGGIAVAAFGLVLYVLLGHTRGLLSAVIAIGPPVTFALVRAYDADLLATSRFDEPVAAAQRSDLLTVVVTCALAAAVLRTVLLLADRGLARISLSEGRSRAAKLIGVVALVGVLAGVVVATGVPERIESVRRDFTREKSSAGLQDQRDHIAQWSNEGRKAHWRVALDEYHAEPLHGSGAGTFQLAWERARPQPPSKVRNAHSLYLEVLSELGWPGLLVLVVALGTPLAVAAARLRRPERHAHAAFLAAAVALLVHAGIDWDWEMPGLFLWFFAASGVVLARPAGGERSAVPGRLTRLLAGLACLALVLTPAMVYRSQRALDRSATALYAGDCATAIDGALDSVDALSARAEPFEVLGYCDARAGRNRLAVRAMESARLRDPDNWEYAYGLAITQALAGRDARAAIADARRLNPLDEQVRILARALQSRSKARRRRAAGRAQIPFS